METKPVFCSECGAKLTGSATFCASCGAKQEAVPAPAPVVTPTPAPVVAPENTLSPKATISKFGLIMTILAVGVTLLGVLLTFLYGVALYRDIPNNRPLLLGFFSFKNVLISCIVPLVSILLVLTKNKKVTIIGLILAVASLALQFIFAIVYAIGVPAGLEVSKLNFILGTLNGEGLFYDLWRIFKVVTRNPAQVLPILLSFFGSLCYWLKNILAAVGCLVAAKQKQT